MWQEACRKGDRLSFKVVSGSMSPAIRAGEVVRIRKIPPGKIRTGDIVAFRQGKNIIVHRVIGKRRAGRQLSYRQMGDAGRTSGSFYAGDLIGRVTTIQKDEREINLESPTYITINRITAWRLRYRDMVNRTRSRPGSLVLRFLMRPVWTLSRRLLFRYR